MQCPGQVREVDTISRTTSLEIKSRQGAGTTTDLHITTGPLAGFWSKKYIYNKRYMQDLCCIQFIYLY